MSDVVPTYLVPECLKAAYEEKLKELAKAKTEDTSPEYQKKIQRVLKHIDIEE
jgi:hypothetical protein